MAVCLPVRMRSALEGTLVFARHAGTPHALGARPLDEGEAHVADGGHAVDAGLALHLRDDVLDGIELVGIEGERLGHERIAFDELGRREAQRQVGAKRVVLDEVHDAVDATVHRAPIGTIGLAEVDATGT